MSVYSWRLVLIVLYFLPGPQAIAGVFSINSLDSSISSYEFSASGRLMHRGFVALPKNPKAVAVHPDGKTVYVVSKTTSLLSVFNNTASGLQEYDFSPLKLGLPSPFDLVVHPSGRYLYIASRAGAILAYSILEAELKPVKGSPFKSGPRTRSLRLHPSGKFLYAVNAHANSISAYRVDQKTGGLQELTRSPFVVAKKLPTRTMRPIVDVPQGAGGLPYDVTVHPNGNFVLVSNWASASVSVLAVDSSSGALSPVAGSPFATVRNPFAVSVHPGGSYVYISCWSDHQIHVYSMDPVTGNLVQVQQLSSGGLGPGTVEFNSSGEVAYVSNSESDTLSVFRFYSKTGKLQLRQQLQTRSGPWSLALDESSHSPGKASFLYAMDLHRRYLMAFSVGRKGAVLLQATTTLPNRPVDMVNMASGRLALIVYKDSPYIDGYVVSTRTKKWSRVIQKDMGLGKGDKQILLDRNEKFLYVLNKKNRQLSVLSVEATPRVVLLKQQSQKSSRAEMISIDGASRFLFESRLAENKVSVRGSLNTVQPLLFERRKWGSPYSIGEDMDYVLVDSSARYLYTASRKANIIKAYGVQHRSGALRLLPGLTMELQQAGMLLTHPYRPYVYAVEKASKVSVYKQDLSGRLSKVSSSNLPHDILSLVFSANGRFAFISYNGQAFLDVYTVESDGSLKFLNKRQTQGRRLKLYSSR